MNARVHLRHAEGPPDTYIVTVFINNEGRCWQNKKRPTRTCSAMVVPWHYMAVNVWALRLL